jgi:hypothetical protein
MTENTNYIFEELLKAVQPNRGLFVIPLPTGAGKTYNSCLMMAEELKKEDARRIIYVTDAKKQLDATIEDIEKNLKKTGLKLKMYDILRVYSQEEQWERAFTDPDIRMRMEASKLFQGERAFTNLKRLYSYTDVTDEVAEEISKNRLRLMEKVRKEVFTPIRQTYKKESDEVIASHIVTEYPILEELYPELLFYKSKIIVLTASKLHTIASPKLVRKGTQPYWKHIENSLVIVDESDRVKEAAMKRLFDCECGRRRRFNFWGLCYFICLHYQEVMDMQKMPEWADHKMNIQDMLKAIRTKKEELIDDIDPQKILCGLELKENVNRGNFIFYDEDQTFSAENVVLSVHNNKEEYTSYLLQSKKTKDQNDKTLSFVANRIMLFLKGFVQIVDKHAEVYASIENELRKKKGTDTTVDLEGELAFYHIIKYMGVNEGNTEYRSALQELRNRTTFQTPRSNNSEETDGKSIYDKGISFIEIYSHDNDRYSCCFDYHEMRCMPENVLLDMVNHNRVIMCSATADCQTPIHNYDFNYIAKQGVKVEKMGNDALHKIEKYIALNYANPKVEFSLYNEEETEPKEILEDYLGKCSLALKDCLDFVMDGKNKFNKNNSARIVNMLNHYMDFMKKPEAKAWLYFQPFSYTGNSSIGIKKVLNILQQARVTKRGEVYEVSVMDPYVIDDGTTSRRADIYPKLNVCFLSGEYFKDDLEAVEKLLAEQPELKMFCFVCYQSGAVGVNYLFDTDAKYRKKCCLEAPNTKDRKDTRCNFDGIIMDKPTNFIPLLDVNDYLKACISLSILGTDNQLTLKEKSDFQRDLLRRRHHCITDDLNELKNREIQIKAVLKGTPAYDAFCLKWAVQALGRITRSTVFNKIIHVAIGKDMAYSMIIARKPEVQTELLKYVLQSIDKDPCILDRINGKDSEVNIAFKNGEHRRERHISELIGISFKGTDKYARQARNRVHKIREYVMKHPEFGNREDIETSMRMYYVQAEEVKKMNLNYTDSCVHMDAIMRQRFIRNYFEKNGYCTAWKGKAWVISPQIIQQVYIGYFGEQVFKAILENAGCTITSLKEEIWERADWVVNNQLYVDVKYMVDGDFNRHVKSQAWERKIKDCGGDYVIVNVPRYVGNYSYSHSLPLESGTQLPVINGLIDVETGAIIDNNVQNILNILAV